MTEKNKEEIAAFAKRMHDKGAAGFAAGVPPWETWDDFEDRVGSRVWQGTAERVVKQKQSTHNFGDRVLTAMTALAVATLAIGIVGVYITQNSTQQFENNSTQLLSTSPAVSPDTRETTGIDTGEEFVALNDASTTAAPVNPNVNNSTTVDSPVKTPLINDDGSISLPITPIDTGNITAETALQQAETVVAIATPSAKQTHATNSDAALPETPIGGSKLAAAIQTQPTTTVAARLAAKSAVQMPDPDNNTSLPKTPASGKNPATTTATQPIMAAMPVENPGVQTPDLDIDSPPMQATLDNLPAPAAGTPLTQPSASTLDAATTRSASVIKTGKPGTVPATASNATADKPVVLSRLTADEAGKPLQPGQAARQNANTGKQGDWSINVASYARASAAKKMKDRFLEKGVATEQIVATVNGKTYYRLRITGFANKQAALSQSVIVREKLGLDEIWVTKK